MFYRIAAYLNIIGFMLSSASTHQIVLMSLTGSLLAYCLTEIIAEEIRNGSRKS